MAETPREADFVIIGAGSAGCVLAERLSTNPSNRVVILEAGGWDWNPLIHIPFGTGKMVRSRMHGWGYWTEPDPKVNNRRIFWPRGRVVGGSGSINSMAYVRGHARDYDLWAQSGATGWSYADVLPYFRKPEGHRDRPGDTYHGTDGPWRITKGDTSNPLTHAFIEAASQAGYRVNDDFNGAVQEGVGVYDFNLAHGRRWSTSVAYLRPSRQRPNLTIQVKARITRIVVEGGRATAVEFTTGPGQPVERIAVGREILLCGGAINSPQILMLSGIGAPDQITPHKIPMVHELPGVGANLQDHLDVPVRQLCTQPVTLHSMIRADRVGFAMLQAALFRTGYAATFPVGAGAFLRTRPELEMPDIQMHLLLGLGASRVRWPILSNGSTDPLEQEGFTVRVCQLRPDSRGHIALASSDPFALAKIHANYLATDNDLKTLRDGARTARDILAQPALAPFRGAELHPGAEIQSDEDMNNWIRNVADTIYHPVGTCKMGTDPMAVVDPELKVHGLDGLRVVDGSVMPTVVGGNTQAPIVMIAEKAADLILGNELLPPEEIPEPNAEAA